MSPEFCIEPRGLVVAQVAVELVTDVILSERARTASATVLPTVVSNSAARRLSSLWVPTSIRTLVLCMQISIQDTRGVPKDAWAQSPAYVDVATVAA